jgi:uncharacterized protein YjbI with pentapeptide repeats
MVKVRELLPKLFSKDSTELVKTGAESAKAVLELGKAINEKKDSLAALRPYLGQISSLLDVLNSPWAQVLKESIPFAPLAMTLLSLSCEHLKQEPSLEQSLLLVAQEAYLKSWQVEWELAKNSDSLKGLNLDNESKQIDLKLQKLGDLEIDEAKAKQIITALPSSVLVGHFNAILFDRLLEIGVATEPAQQFVDRVAWNAPRYVNQMVAENAEKIKVLSEIYRNGGKEIIASYASIDEYLQTKIQPLPDEKVFDETDLTLRHIYIPLQVKPLTSNGEELQDLPIHIHAWAAQKLCEDRSKAILFIQGEAGRGKSVFCRMFADLVRRELAFTPILIRLRDVLTLGDTLTETLEKQLENFDFTKDKSWLTNKNQRFLFIFDGFDELILQGRSTGGLKYFLGQVEKFQSDSHHRILITGRPLAMQGIERSAFREKCLERVKLLPMNNEIRNDWLRKWTEKSGGVELAAFIEFLKACPTDVEDKLAREPLLLYVLARIHREGAIGVNDLIGTSGMAAKVKVYDKAIEWVLAKQRDSLNEKMFDYQLTIEELRQLLTEVSVCVIQSGGEIAKVNAIEYRLTKDTHNNLKETFDKILTTATDDKKALNNLLTTFYLQPARGDREGSVEFAHKSFGEFLFAERIKEAICDWSSVTKTRKGEEDQIKQNDLEWQIYDLLGYGCLTPDIVDYLREMLANSDDWQPLRLFERLNSFWESWCEGEFIDRTEDNLPQKKKKILAEQMPERESRLGIRQVDVYTGLNVLILLLELHRYAKSRDECKDRIIFYPSGESQLDEYTNRLLKVIHYSDSISIGAFCQNLGLSFIGANLISANLSGADLSSVNFLCAELNGANLNRAYLSGANLNGAELNGANLNRANLSHAYLHNAHLFHANLSGADLRVADLSCADLNNAYFFDADLSDAYLNGANLSGAVLSRANLSDANLSRANLSGANLSRANLSGAVLSNVIYDRYTDWGEVRGLESAIDIPPELKQHLGLD